MTAIRRILSILCIASTLALAACVTNPYRAPSDVSTPPWNAIILANGLAYRVLKAGTGNQHPTLGSIITVNYTGWTTDGRKFDSTINLDGSASPATVPLKHMIQGWQQVVPLMVSGEKIRVWIPGNLAYDRLNRPGAPHGMLVFDIDLLHFNN